MTGRRPGRQGTLWRGVLAAAGTLMLGAVLLGLVPPGTPELTGASWQDTTQAGTTLQTATVPPAVLTAECQYFPALAGLGAWVEVYWNPPAGYGPEQAQIWTSQDGLGSLLSPLAGFSLKSSTHYDTSAGHHVTTVPANLLGGFLGGSAELELSIVMQHSSGAAGWTSDPVATATNAGWFAGIDGSCRNLD